MTSQRGEEYLTIEEAGALLGRSRRTVERYTSDGRIKRYRRGMRVLYKKSDLERLSRELEEITEEVEQDGK